MGHRQQTTTQQYRDANAQRRVGLARMLSKLGYCSRSQAAMLVRAGRVTLKGRVRRDPETPASVGDPIAVDGQTVRAANLVYLMMNKPRGLVTTTSDEKGRETVYSLLDRTLPWVAPAGRLDKASEGLLLFTNDSEWAARIANPESHVQKTYHVQIAALLDDALILRLQEGVCDGQELLRVKRATRLRSGQRNLWLEIVLDEGRNRQIRRIFDALGVEVLRLVRVAIGPVRLGDLKKGEIRELTAEEKAALG